MSILQWLAFIFCVGVLGMMLGSLLVITSRKTEDEQADDDRDEINAVTRPTPLKEQ